MNSKEVVQRLQTTVAAGAPVIVAGAGSGLIAKAAAKVIILGHGGPRNDPASVATVLNRTGADGYVTGSTGEHMPVEEGVAKS
jgi:predicted TIM-barrel enzyme